MILCQVFPTSLKGATLTWYGGLPHQSIDSFDTLVECYNSQYATSQLHCLTSTAKASLHQVDDEPLRKFIDKFGQIAVQIRNLNPEVVLHSMLLVLRPGKFIDSLCKKPPNGMDEL